MSEDNLPWALAQAYDKLVIHGEKPEKRYMKIIRAAAQSFYGFCSLQERCDQLTESNTKLISTIFSLQLDQAKKEKEIEELRLVIKLDRILNKHLQHTSDNQER
jgi:hypothetical protein